MSWNTLATIAVPSVLGIAGGLASAWFVRWLRRNEIGVAMAKTRLEMDQTKLQMEQTQLQIEQVRQNMTAALKFQGASTKTATLYDSSGGFTPFDFKVESRADAKGRVTLIDDDVKDGILSLERTNEQGTMMVVFNAYAIRGSSASTIPPGTPGRSRRMRAELEARVLGGAQTIVLAIKDPESEPGKHLAEWRERLDSDGWKSIDAYFKFPADRKCLFRVLNRSVAKAPSSFQMRNLVLTEKES